MEGEELGVLAEDNTLVDEDAIEYSEPVFFDGGAN